MIILDNNQNWRTEPTYSLMSPRYIFNESAYSILSRFSKRNAIKSSKLVKIFSNSVNFNRLNATKNLSSLFSVDIHKMEHNLRLSKAEVYQLFLVPGFVVDMGCVEEGLKYCPQCLSQQRHYTMFQLAFIHECPLHRTPLIQYCPNCRASISNRLEASTFKLPYGCPCCGMLFDSGGSLGRQFCRINPAGERLLRSFSHAISRKADHSLEFSFQRQIPVYCDNVLCLSKSIVDAVNAERTFFYWLINSMSVDKTGVYLHNLPKYVLNSHELACCKLESIDEDALLNDLFATYKSLSRHLIRKLRAGNCLRRVSKALWWSLVGDKQPQVCPTILSLIGWRVFWLNARAPADTLQAQRGSRGKIREWLQSITQDRSIALFPKSQRVWLISHIFSHALTTTLEAFFSQQVRSDSMNDTPETVQWSFDSLPISNCWAAYINNENTSSVTTFMPGPQRPSLAGVQVNVISRICCCVLH